MLLVISALVLVALKPPRLRMTNSQELFNVEHRPISDGLSKLPATYDGLTPDKKADPVKVAALLDPGVPWLTEASGDPVDEAERVEKAREAQVFFRLQLKVHEPAAQGPDAAASPSPKTAEGDLTTLAALRAAERGRALAAGGVDLYANDTAEATRKLSFLKAGPEKDIPHPGPPRARNSSTPNSRMTGVGSNLDMR